MGNCMWGASCPAQGSLEDVVIRVVTSTGGIMEFHPPVTAERITNEFPGYGIFRRHHSLHPLLHNEPLAGGHVYYLLPLHRLPANDDITVPTTTGTAPYRMSLDGRWRRAAVEAFPATNKKAKSAGGVWKVKLVISPEQLTEILAQESHTGALIDSVRTIARCAAGVYTPASASNSDDRSPSASSHKTASQRGSRI